MRSSLCILILLLGLTACQSPAPPALSAGQIIDLSASRMNELASFHFTIDRSGAPAYLDPDETLSFRLAEGDYLAPDRSRALVRIIAPGFVTDVQVVSIAEIQWQTNVLTGRWEQLPPDWGFNPAVLFDAELGMQAILKSDLLDMTQAEPERLENGPDKLLYVIQGRADGKRLYQMSGGLIGPEPVSVQLWIAPDTFELHRVLVTEAAAGAEESSVWQVDLTQFDQPVVIEPPDATESET